MSSKCLKTPALTVAILQLNVEGLTTFKIANLEQLAGNNVTVIALQETHLEKTNILGVPGYRLAVHTINKARIRLHNNAWKMQRYENSLKGNGGKFVCLLSIFLV